MSKTIVVYLDGTGRTMVKGDTFSIDNFNTLRIMDEVGEINGVFNMDNIKGFEVLENKADA